MTVHTVEFFESAPEETLKTSWPDAQCTPIGVIVPQSVFRSLHQVATQHGVSMDDLVSSVLLNIESADVAKVAQALKGLSK